MNAFEQYAYDQAIDKLDKIGSAMTDDIYALSFYLSDSDDDPRYPILQLGYNTRTQCASCSPRAGQGARWPIASDSAEAKWNFAFWLQNELTLVGVPDTQGGQLLHDRLVSEGLWYSDEEEEDDFDRRTPLAEAITDRFTAMCVRVARALHEQGIIVQTFGAPIPVIVHGLDYHPGVAAQTVAANPPRVAQEFVAWIDAM